jgi:putative (di)nucleoside polyphosphate hydrolase
MATVTSCGVVLLNDRQEVFVCHATGTSRWDLPKGISDPGETPIEAAVREAWEETGLRLDADALHDLGVFDYLPGKRLHLFALRVGADAFDITACRCISTFPHHATGRPTLEVDGYD